MPRMGDPENDISIDMGLLSQGESRSRSSDMSTVASTGNLGVNELPSNSGIDPWLRSLIEDGGEGRNNKSQQVKMHKVSPMLREVESNKKCFDPLVVSIGPYHHGKSELQSMEKHKTAMARQYVKMAEGNNVEIVKELYDKVVKVVPDARNCYLEGSTDKFNDKAFAKMMFLDGCFILQFINCFSPEKRREMGMKSHDIAFVQRDLLLMENQLPFLVLEALMVSKKEEWLDKMVTFIEYTRAHSPHDHKKQGWLDWIIEKCFRPKNDGSHDTKEQSQYHHLLGILHAQLISSDELTQQFCPVSDWSSYRSTKELKTAGIQFKPSKTRRLTDVSFKSDLIFGTLTLPAMTVDDSTKSMLLNLVAYESCPAASDEFGVTSYLCFMDVLLDRAEDVKELRSSGVLLNLLGSDQQVADLFNEIAKDLVPNPYAYAKVKGNIEKHYNDKAKIWITEWLYTHFSTPWTVQAFIGAIVALALSCIQTYFAAFDQDKSKNK